MSCNGCYNGCTQIISDRCVKYTGDAIVGLEIASGDPMSEVIEKITDYLLDVISGAGITPNIDPQYICTLVDDYLPDNADLNDVLTAIIRAACNLQTQVDALDGAITTLNGSYTVSCLSGVSANSGTHSILQAVIYKVCAMSNDITELNAKLCDYIKIIDLDDYIEAYIIANTSTKINAKMVPYVVYPFYGVLAGKFDADGIGIGDWEKIYLCNGANGTPDLRGRTIVGVTDMEGAVALDAEVDPAVIGNPTYVKGSRQGVNNVTLSKNQMPQHTHTAVSTPNDPGHKHLFGGDDSIGTKLGYTTYGGAIYPVDEESGSSSLKSRDYYTKKTDGTNNPQTTGITVSTFNQNEGGGASHTNIQPVFAMYYIIYIP